MHDARGTLTSEAWLPALEEERVDVLGRLLDADLARLGVRPAARALLRELIEGVWWSRSEGDGDRPEVVAVVGEVIPVVAGDPVEPFLALYIRVVCEAAWDLTWDHGPLLEVLAAAEDAWAATPPDPGSEAAAAVRAMLALRVDLTLESACSTGDLRTTVRAAQAAGDLLAGDVAAAGQGADSPLRRHIVDLLSGQAVYADAVDAGARAAADFLDGTGDTLEEALETLEAAEADVDDAAARSEIRAHRVAVERLVAARDEDWLRVDEGAVVATFPFGLRHADQAAVVATVQKHAADWSLGSVPLANHPTSLLLVDDVWRGDDPLKRRYEGTQLDLPDLLLVGREGEPVRARATITISQLGNHYVRVELPLEGARPHTLASLVWMAAPEYGDLHEVDQRLVFAPPDQDDEAEPPATGGWVRLSAMVQKVLTDLVAELERSGMPTVSLSFRPGMYHVVTTIGEASVLPGGREEGAVALDAAGRIPLLFGSQSVCHPIPAGVGSIAFWARYSAPLGTVVDCAGLTDEYLLVSENHTLIASFSSPDYMVSTVGQAAEFAASIEGMFAAWQDELSAFYLGLTPHLRDLETDAEVDLEKTLAALEHSQLRLRQFLTSARVTLLFIASPALVTSPVMRDTITRFLDLRLVWTRRADFTDVAGQALADRVTDLIETWLRRREEDRARREEDQARRNQLRIDTMIAVLTGIGISGVLAMVQTGFAVEEWGSVVLVIMVLALAALVGYASYRWSRRTLTPKEDP
ncbi:hypothetical protein [Ornithinicoccus hortensis]|uniref:Uncharacterized protein n=1 Tax=Ornithinicoccus hortensis TaxID=82346 RepID=A0A542YV05_9MICO|nr:hypothetical protein [Ornithinicoccus hortensis]TQL51919.1 hypothetical protein FB467_3086 [Ornithinicoccus hortensis]